MQPLPAQQRLEESVGRTLPSQVVSTVCRNGSELRTGITREWGRHAGSRQKELCCGLYERQGLGVSKKLNAAEFACNMGSRTMDVALEHLRTHEQKKGKPLTIRSENSMIEHFDFRGGWGCSTVNVAGSEGQQMAGSSSDITARASGRDQVLEDQGKPGSKAGFW